MELSGHSPFIVFDDVDLDKVTDIAIFAKFRNNGQVCISPSRFYIHENKKNEFTKLMIEKIKKLKIGNGIRRRYYFRTFNYQKKVGRIEKLVELTKKEGANIFVVVKNLLVLIKATFMNLQFLMV